ncbi:MAG: hypothetical protein K9M49_02880 [Candidatus Marinimicrobia bacterium]|nr:hypothetical protein [Candidatus Neomarinimicrobiota bacterium]MCF7904079.1 hypothetical protein [Candidatus Neomarinimicrobiota bacterium]
MNSRITDERLEALLKESIENPPPALLEKVIKTPNQVGLHQSWSMETHFDSMVDIVSGMIGLWILGLVFIYRDLLASFFTNLSFFSPILTSLRFLVPLAGISALLILFSRCLSPNARSCAGEPPV